MMQIPKEYTWEFEGHLFASLSSSKKPQTQLVKWMALSPLPVKRKANMICRLPASSLRPTPQPVQGPQSHCMLAFLSDLLNCFDCCGKWITLKWKPGQIWFGLETTQGFKRSQ